MKSKRKIAVCPRCFKVRLLTKHHLTPKRFFNKKNNQNIIYICEECHKEIEKIIPRFRKLLKEEYFDIHKKWLQGKNVMVV